VLAVGLALLFELAFQGLDAVPHLGYERIASRSRLVGVSYITGRVLVGVQ
jgi:hypothetical protein